MKKKVLFVMNNLTSGGAEKSLLSLLENIDYSKFDVDLMLLKHEGLFINNIPYKVKLLKEPKYLKYFDLPTRQSVIELLKAGKYNLALNRILGSYVYKIEKSIASAEQRLWRYSEKSLDNINDKYDVAIGYMEGRPIYYVIDKVDADIKIGWIHSDYEKLGINNLLDIYYFDKLNSIVTVSEECANVLKRNFPQFKEKIKVVLNIINPNIIKQMAKSDKGFQDEYRGTKIVTVGRLHYAKGIDLAVEACEILVKSGCNIRWYVIGEGTERKILEEMISKKNLKKNFILMGEHLNPYPYIKQSDIYVQPSRFEGYGISVAEAKILCKPIVVTNYNTSKVNIDDGINGVITEMSAMGIYNGIKSLLTDKNLCEYLSKNLSKENLYNDTEIKKLYSLIQ